MIPESLKIGISVAALLVLSVAPWPTYRLISIPSFRRDYSCVAVRVWILIALYFAVLAAIVTWLPRLIVPFAAIAAVLLVAERWRARGNFGKRANLPPGSLTLVPRGPWVDVEFFARQAETYGPVFKMSQFFRPMVCVLGPREGLRLFKESGDKLIQSPVRFNKFIPKGFLRFMEQAVHEEYRPIFRRAFNKTVIDNCKTDFRGVLETDLSKMAAVSSSRTIEGIHPTPYIRDIVFKLVARLFIGVNENSDDMGQLKQLYKNVVLGKAACQWRNDDAEVNDNIAHIILRQASAAQSSLPACFLAEIIRNSGEAARDRTVVMNLAYLIKTVTLDLTGLLSWAIKMLVDNPQWAENLRVATEESAAESEQIASLILKETLRLERSEFIFRKTVEPIEYRGFTIPRNWLVRVCIRDGHRDPDTFPDPNTFDPNRFVGRSYSREEYSPLGMGAHSCLGEQVIYGLAPVFLIELTRSFELLKHNDGPREYAGAHWQPSSALRVEMRQR